MDGGGRTASGTAIEERPDNPSDPVYEFTIQDLTLIPPFGTLFARLLLSSS